MNTKSACRPTWTGFCGRGADFLRRAGPAGLYFLPRRGRPRRAATVSLAFLLCSRMAQTSLSGHFVRYPFSLGHSVHSPAPSSGSIVAGRVENGRYCSE
jgi:hypothetical protein